MRRSLAALTRQIESHIDAGADRLPEASVPLYQLHHAARQRRHAVSLLYRCRLAGALDPARRYTPEAPLPDQWLWHEKCPENLIPEQRAYAALMEEPDN